MSAFSLILSAIVLVVYLTHATSAASVRSTHRSTRDIVNRLTCRHQNEAKKKDWKKCVKTTDFNLIPSYKDSGLGLISKISQSELPLMDIPPK